MPEVKKEWPLMLFTALCPPGVGAGVVLSGIFSRHELNDLIFPASLTLSGTIAFAFLVSSAHIGRRMRMPGAVRNIFSSWLSREIFLLSCSCGLYLAAAVMYFLREKHQIRPEYITYAFWLASGLGVVGLVSMQNVYRLRSVRLWTGLRGISMVFSTAFLLGSMEAVLILHIFDGKSVEDMLWRFMPVFFAPLFFDLLQLRELKRLGHKIIAVVMAVLRLPVYASVFHLTGRMDFQRLVIVMGIALAGDVVLRLFFFGEETTSFRLAIERARQARITPSTAGPASSGRVMHSGGD